MPTDTQHPTPAAKSRAEFRRFLNAQDAASRNPVGHRQGRFHQRTRLYGDYLFAQDRAKFEVDYAAWRAEGGAL